VDVVHVPNADLDWVGSPRIEVGYRLPEGYGEFLASFRSMVSEGTAVLPAFDVLGSGFLRSRLNTNVLDLDYRSRELTPLPCWDLRWQAGIRIAALYFDSRATGLFLEQRTSNNFVGAGPHGGVEVARTLPLPGLALFGRLDGAVVVAGVEQDFEETQTFGPGVVLGGATHLRRTVVSPVLSFQTGVSWTPPGNAHWLRFAFGYQFEHWWGIGDVGGSRADLTVQGLFFRGEFDF
jgi:hypothetical protein